jgi:hypothetical protein
MKAIGSLLVVLLAGSLPVTAVAQARKRAVTDPAPLETKAS